MRRHGGVIVSTDVLHQEDSNQPGSLGLVCVEFAYSPSHSPNTFMLIGDSKLAVGVNGCLSLCISPKTCPGWGCLLYDSWNIFAD